MSLQKPRVAIFVESHEGYGHFNIVSQLTKQLEEQGAEVMILSGTLNYAGAAQTFNFRDSRVINLPLVDYRIAKGGKWEYLTNQQEIYEDAPDYIAKRKALIKDAITDFKPDLVVTELFPFQQSFRKHDMDAVKELTVEGVIKPEVVSLCRDIIHNSKPQNVIRCLDEYYDRILVRGDKDFVKLADSQPDWAGINVPIEYMGNYITAMPERSNDEPDKARHVVVFGGGGYYDKDLPFFESVIRSREHSQKFGDRIWDIYLSENAEKHFIADPEDPSGQKQISAFTYLERLAAHEGHGMIRVFQPIDSKKFRKQLANAAMTVTRGGYNTTFELFAAKQPQLVIPRDSPEQVQRANALYKNGIAQVFPEYPIPEVNTHNVMRRALKDPAVLARAIDITPDISATVPELNNHGAENTAKRLLHLIAQKQPGPKLNLLISYENDKHKKRDAFAIAEHLEQSGHTVTMIDTAKAQIIGSGPQAIIRADDKDIALSSFDGATMRSPTEAKGSKMVADAMRDAGLPIYQDFPMLVVAGDKMLSQKLFEQHEVPTPKTYGVSFSEPADDEALNAFIASLGDGPFVVKSNRGWNGAQVKIVDTKDEAIEHFHAFHAQSTQAQEGGALIQEFIESNPVRRRDYRIQTVAGVNAAGEPEISVVAAAKRVAQPGMRITNTSQGADKIRVSLDKQEAHAFYVEKNHMPEAEFEAKIASGDIELLSPELKAAAIKAARAFGTGSLGIDIITGDNHPEPKVLEVNPFAGGSGNFEKTHGFTLFKPWADSFAGFVAHAKLHTPTEEKPKHGAQHLKWQPPVKRDPLVRDANNGRAVG